VLDLMTLSMSKNAWADEKLNTHSIKKVQFVGIMAKMSQDYKIQSA